MLFLAEHFGPAGRRGGRSSDTVCYQVRVLYIRTCMGTCQCGALGPGTENHDSLVGHSHVPNPSLARSIPAQLDSRRFLLPPPFVPLPSASHYLTCSTIIEKLTLASLLSPFPLPSLSFPLPLFCFARSVSPRSSHINICPCIPLSSSVCSCCDFKEASFVIVFFCCRASISAHASSPGSFFPRQPRRPTDPAHEFLGFCAPATHNDPLSERTNPLLLRSSRAILCSAPSLFSRIVFAQDRYFSTNSASRNSVLSALPFAVLSSNQRLESDEKNFTDSVLPRRRPLNTPSRPRDSPLYFVDTSIVLRSFACFQ